MDLSKLYERAGETKNSPAARDTALLGARVVLAWLFVYHGAETLFGAFHGPGIQRAEIFYGQIAGLHPAVFFTVLGGCIEFFGGIGVGLGILGRLAAAGLVGDMLMAMITVTFANGVASNRPGGGYELNLALIGVGFVVALLGTGSWSLDAVIRSRWSHRRPALVLHPNNRDHLAAS
ncbi:MAG TPA: DoxX family protein [Acidimicrobiales bacterium]|jgi:putative oxidoreductase|nr:DoxX family protein [Acidimicrobiales bacterium]